jgi:aspartate aminotransferase
MTPNGAFYAFPNTANIYGSRFHEKTIASSTDLALYLLEEANVALVPGDAFGDDNYLRISYATSLEDIRKGMDRIRQAVQNLVPVK